VPDDIDAIIRARAEWFDLPAVLQRVTEIKNGASGAAPPTDEA
jgi:hypothetical protein